MGIGIDVTTGKMYKEGQNNEKTFTILLDTYAGKATDPHRKQCNSRTWKNAPLSRSSNIYDYSASWLEFVHNDVVTGCRDHISEEAFGGDGSVHVNMTIWAGVENKKTHFIEVAKEGYYMYASAADIDAGDRNKAMFTDNANTVVKLYAGTVLAACERRTARNAFVNAYIREERLMRDRIKRQLKTASNAKKKELKKELADAQKALDEKRNEARETEEYKAFLIPGPMESISTIPMAAA